MASYLDSIAQYLSADTLAAARNGGSPETLLTAVRGKQPDDISIDLGNYNPDNWLMKMGTKRVFQQGEFDNPDRWAPGAQAAALKNATWDSQYGLLYDIKDAEKYWIPEKVGFMDKVMSMLPLVAAGIMTAGVGGAFGAGSAGSASSSTLFTGGAGAGEAAVAATATEAGAAGAAAAGGYTAGQQAALDSLIHDLTIADALESGAAGAAGASAVDAGYTIEQQQALDSVIGDLLKADQLDAGGKGAGLINQLKDAYGAVKPYKDVLSIAQTAASVFQGQGAADATKQAAGQQQQAGNDALAAQQAAQQAQADAAAKALELQRQAQEKQLAQQNATLQEQLRMQQAMASYQQQVYSQQLAQAAKSSKLAEEQLRRNNQRQPDFAAALSGNRRAGQMGVAGTMLTGAGGLDPGLLTLGRNTLLGA